jgi:uncharacterized membrane protein YphA (DoxX/SURF4 family)
LLADVARVTVGVVFLIAAVAKLALGRPWVVQASSSGTPRAFAAVVPWIELAVGAALAAGVAEPWPAVAAAALLVAFTVWIVSRLAAGRHPPCACFGAVSAGPLSWWHVARNAALLALAVAAA